jgi:hypothetical protein
MSDDPKNPRHLRRRSERHPLFGALKGVTSVPPGVDLTEPADPDWGKIYEENPVVPAKRNASRDD